MIDPRYKFSVVIPAYNVKPYIADAIESVIAQDIGFENIQLILVDDGSTDGTGAILDEYAQKYPGNVVAVHREHGGVSGAGNSGIALAGGKYVNFLDGNDMWECHVFSRVFSFFEQHYDETDVVSCPIYHFSEKPNKKEPHNLNAKFRKGSRIISLAEEPDAILHHCNNSFFKREVVTGQRDEFSEDIPAVQMLLMERQTIGVVNNCPYWCRRLINDAELSALRQIDRLEYVFQKLISEAEKSFCHIPKFIQYAIVYDLLMVLRTKRFAPEAGLNSEEIEKFNRLLHDIFMEIDDDIFWAPKISGLPLYLRLLALQIKYGVKPELEQCGNDFMICFPGSSCGKLLSSLPCILDFLTIENNICTLEGRFNCPAVLPYDEIRVGVEANGNCYEGAMKIYHDKQNHVYFGNPTLYQCIFRVEIPIPPDRLKMDLILFLQMRGIKIPTQTKPIISRFFPLQRTYSAGFCIIDRVKCTLLPDGIRLSRRYSAFCDELRFLKELWQKHKKGARKAVAVRLSYHFLKFFKRRPLWLCNDRPEKADDNGEVFFEYLRKNHPEINSVFVLNRNSPDWERLKKIGPVVETCSTRHKMLRLFCDAVVATQTGDYAGNELNKYMYYQDIICKTKIVFLRHGVTKDDLSSYLRKSVANLSGLLTTAPRERQSILDGDYGYSEKEVWLTGLPRHDRLYNAPKKKISIMPTWRMYLFGPVVPGRDFRPLAPGFRESKYRNFYHCLLNDERLLKCAKRHGYQLCFMPHPTFQTHIAEFAISPEVLVYGLDRNISYRDVFAETDLLVTDYSSVFFDFAYLKKPVIYAQFDKDEFFGGDHIYSKGYFDYERDGFGEVEYDLESTVNRIMEYMENNCQLKEKYRERIDSFFVFNDHNCCERVFAEVAKIAGKRKK